MAASTGEHARRKVGLFCIDIDYRERSVFQSKNEPEGRERQEADGISFLMVCEGKSSRCRKCVELVSGGMEREARGRRLSLLASPAP